MASALNLTVYEIEDALLDYQDGIIREHSIGFSYIKERMRFVELENIDKAPNIAPANIPFTIDGPVDLTHIGIPVLDTNVASFSIVLFHV